MPVNSFLRTPVPGAPSNDDDDESCEPNDPDDANVVPVTPGEDEDLEASPAPFRIPSTPIPLPPTNGTPSSRHLTPNTIEPSPFPMLNPDPLDSSIKADTGDFSFMMAFFLLRICMPQANYDSS